MGVESFHHSTVRISAVAQEGGRSERRQGRKDARGGAMRLLCTIMGKEGAMQTGKSNQDTYSDQRYNGVKNVREQCDDRNTPETSRLPKTGSGFWESGGSERRVDCWRPLRYGFVKVAKLVCYGFSVGTEIACDT
jgi:hypothetical protein